MIQLRRTVAPLTCAILTTSGAHAGWPDEPWTDVRVVTATSSWSNGRGVMLDADRVYFIGRFNRVAGRPSTQDGFLQVYHRTPRGWLRGERLVNPGIFGAPTFGDAYDRRDNLIAIGAPGSQLSLLPDEVFPHPRPVGFVRLMLLAPDAESWEPEQLLANVDIPGPTDTGFGAAVAFLSDSLLAIGAPTQAINATPDAGAVHLFALDDNDAWTPIAVLTSDDPFPSERFGHRLAASSGELLVYSPGAPGRDPSVTVFAQDGQGAWTQRQSLATFTTRDSFARMHASENRFALASRQANNPVAGSGAIAVYARQNDLWVREATINPDLSLGLNPVGLNFGVSVAITDDFLVTSAQPAFNDAAQIYRRDANEWTLDAQYIAPSNANGFGFAIAIDADRAAIGAPAANLASQGSGGVYILSRDAECFRDLRADANNDGATDFADLNIILANFGAKGQDNPGDLNRDGVVDMTDLNIILVLFGSPCIPPN